MNESTHPILCHRSSTELSRAILSPRRRDRRCMDRDFDFVVVLTFYFFYEPVASMHTNFHDFSLSKRIRQ